MGYDISYHPISEQQINAWYFDLLKYPEKLEELAGTYHLKDFYKTKYQDTLNAGRETSETDYFDKTHGFFIAVIQGFMDSYFYIRGAALSFSNNAHLNAYYRTWEEFIPPEYLTKKIQNRLIENYCSGVFIPPEYVIQLLEDYHNKAEIKTELDKLFSDGRISIFIKALQFAKERGLGLLEATEVVEPQPFDLHESKSYSDLFNCDQEGLQLYQATAFQQIKEVERQNSFPENEILHNLKVETVHVEPLTAEDDADPIKNKEKGFWLRLFGK